VSISASARCANSSASRPSPHALCTTARDAQTVARNMKDMVPPIPCALTTRKPSIASICTRDSSLRNSYSSLPCATDWRSAWRRQLNTPAAASTPMSAVTHQEN
jgi:hypothetical protein